MYSQFASRVVCTLFYAIARPFTRQFDGSVHTERTRLAMFTKLNSGSWRVQVRRKGKYVNETFLRRKDAEGWALEVERRIDRGEPAVARTSRDAKTFGDLVKLHREDLQEVGKRIGRSKAASLTFLEHRLGRLGIPELDRGRPVEALSHQPFLPLITCLTARLGFNKFNGLGSRQGAAREPPLARCDNAPVAGAVTRAAIAVIGGAAAIRLGAPARGPTAVCTR
jgi:hypothetical protein